jgi:hypothetical protein
MSSGLEKGEMKEQTKFSLLDECRKHILDNLESGYGFEKYKYDYHVIIKKLAIEFSMKNKFRIDAIVDEREDYIVTVLLVGDGVNNKFVFDIREWLRKRKIDNLL